MLDSAAAAKGRTSFRTSAVCRPQAKGLMLAFCVAVCASALSQSPAPVGATQAPAPTSSASKPMQQAQRVTTTVVVHGEVKDDYLPDTVTVGTLDGATLEETPLSATVVTHELMEDQGVRLLSDVVKNDASFGEDYAPVGYYGDFEIRGFPIDLAS